LEKLKVEGREIAERVRLGYDAVGNLAYIDGVSKRENVGDLTFSNLDCYLNARGLTSPLHLTAARLRFLLNVKVYVWAAARDGER
jgi:hypothetical protein